MNKYEVNYKLIFITLSIAFIIFLLPAMLILKKDLQYGMFLIILLVGALIFSITRLFSPQRIKSVTVFSTSIIIEFRKSRVEIPFEDFEKIEYYKHGPFTERIYILAKPYKYEILFELKHFHDLCRRIYAALAKIDKGNIADE